MNAITTKAGDVDTDVGEWLRGNTPLGITESIPPRGVFPPSGPTKAQLESAEFMVQRAGAVEVDRNYESFEENEEESRQEMAGLEAEGHLERIGCWNHVRRRWKGAIATKVATLVKQKSDGTQKVRFIVDMLWGRVAAWLGRATQSIFERARVRTQIYVDDPVLVVRGYGDARRWYLARAILLWAALGARLAFKKASRGTKVTWIGAQYEVLQQGIKVGIDQQRIAKLQEAMASVSAGKGLVNLRSLTGELSWVAGLVPKIRPWVTMLWAACHAADLQHLAASQGRSKARQRPRNMVFTNMVAQPLEWLTAFLQGCHGGVERVRWVSDTASRPNLLIRTDASTTGMGGVLFGSAGEPVAYWTCLLDPEMCSALGVEAGEPRHMTTYELAALHISLVVWAKQLSRKRLGVSAELDSSSTATAWPATGPSRTLWLPQARFVGAGSPPVAWLWLAFFPGSGFLPPFPASVQGILVWSFVHRWCCSGFPP